MPLSRDRISDRTLEWLETDGLGGFASGTPSGIRTRRYHGVLIAARTPPTGRTMLVNALEVFADGGEGPLPLSSHLYAPGVVHPDGLAHLVAFSHEPFPTWRYELRSGTLIEQRLFAVHGAPQVVCSWRVVGDGRVRLHVRPLLSFRDIHALARENQDFRFDAEDVHEHVVWKPYADLPALAAFSNGRYRHEPLWYRNFLYEEERARGFDCIEDLAAPGIFELDSPGTAWLILTAHAQGPARAEIPEAASAQQLGSELEIRELERRNAFASPLERAADAYLVRRGEGRTILAGYPWFTDWGRDTFISLRGLCLATGRIDDARSILLSWAALVSEGMLPNRFLEEGEEPAFNSVDAALLYAVAVGEYLAARQAAGSAVQTAERKTLTAAVLSILEGYASGTRFGIRMDADGLIAAGESGLQLTWMDARADGREVTPRVGKPVEIQALWINALAVGERLQEGRAGERFQRWRAMAQSTFAERFWNEAAGCLYDVVDDNHVPFTADTSLRPNQILAAGGLPLALLTGERARSVVDVVERRLWTPLGLRTLDPDDPRYAGVYEGNPSQRDRAYHQGTAWPWLLGPFVQAWVAVRGSTEKAKAQARERFLAPLLAHLGDAGLGHVSEIADGDLPQRGRGAPFQAWSLGELLRIERSVLGPPRERGDTPSASKKTGEGIRPS
jgi:predicted glycogen debranching enzyme